MKGTNEITADIIIAMIATTKSRIGTQSVPTPEEVAAAYKTILAAVEGDQ